MAPAYGLPRWRRWLRRAFVLGVLSLLIWPPTRADCTDPLRESPSPDGRGVLALCDRPPSFASPRPATDDAADTRGWITLRDARGGLAGVVDLSSVAALRWAPEWREESVRLPGFAEFERPAELSWPRAVLRDRLWRLRAFLGFVAPDAAFR